MKRETKKITSYSPAWIEDVNYSMNPGYLKFKNGFINDIGKIQKRKGWETKRHWTQPGKAPGQEGGLPLDYTQPAAGSDSCTRTNFIHIKSKKQTNGDIYKYCLVHRIIAGQNALVKQIYDNNNNFVSETLIGTPAQFKNYGPVKFIETNDQVYIINTFNDLTTGKKRGYIWKYAYGDNIKQYDTDRIHNISISAEMYVTSEIITTGAVGLVAGTYWYLVAPVYNTGTEGRHYDAPFTYTANQVTIIGTNKSVILKFFSPYDPYIIGYNIYRSKVNQSITQGVFKLLYVAKPDNLVSAGALMELPSPTSPIFVIGGVKRKVTDMNTADTALGSQYSTVPFLNTRFMNWFNNPGTRGTNPPDEVLNNTLNLPISCGMFADNRMILAYGNSIYMSLVDKTDSLDALLTLIIPLAHETENPAVAIEQVGPWFYVWCKSCVYKLMPTSSVTAPYSLQLVTNSYGCDNIQSVAVQDNIAYFFNNKKLNAMNAYGQTKPIGGPIASVFETAIDDIYMSKNDSDKYIKIMFRTAGGSKEINFYPERNMFVDLSGYRDIFNPTSGNEVELLVKSERNRLLAYEHNAILNEEWGVTFDGDIVKRTAVYTDQSQANAVTTWQDYVYPGTIPAITTSYNVDLEFIKAFTYSERVSFSSAVFSGTGKIWVSYALDDSEAYSEEKEIALSKDGVETVIDAQGFTCKLRVRHDDNENIDLDYFGVKIASQGKVEFMNTVDNGEGE